MVLFQNMDKLLVSVNGDEKREEMNYTSKRSNACHAIPPAVAKSMHDIPRAPRVSNLPCPERKENQL